MTRPKRSMVGERIHLLRFRTQYEMAASFLRFQEHYESRAFRAKRFDLESFMDWYARRYGNFTYYQDWVGFNLPSSALEPFYEGRFDPLLEKEKRLLSCLERFRGEDFYVIGVCDELRDGAPATLQHELAHALFCTRPDYRREVLRALSGFHTGKLEAQLYRDGYARQVLKDEVHASVLADLKDLGARERRRLAPLHRQLSALYREHARLAHIRIS